MSTVIDSLIFHNVFSTEDINAVWSDKTRTSYYLQFEAALAKVQGQLGIIPEKAAVEIQKHCVWDELDVDELRKQTELIGYPVLPVVRQIVKKVNAVEDQLGEWTHWGATTQDLTDTATVLQLRDTLVLVESGIDKIINALRLLSEKHKTTPMAGRSNLQQAVPQSFGFKMARLLACFERHKARLQEIRPRLLILEFGGASGTLATISEYSSYSAVSSDSGKQGLGLRCQELLAKELGLGMPAIAWHTERDNIAEVGNFFAVLTATCAKFATDLKIMMMPEINEASEPFVHSRGSSSTMPQKRNPIGSAYICAMASSVRSMSSGLIEAVVADFERSTGPWEIEWVLLPQICCLTHSIMKHTSYLVSGLEVNAEGMAKNLKLTQGNVVSEAVMMGLGKSLGRSFAHDLVYDLCRRAVVEQTPLIDLLLQDEDIKRSKVSEDELRSLCDPAKYLGYSAEMVDRVLASI